MSHRFLDPHTPNQSAHTLPSTPYTERAPLNRVKSLSRLHLTHSPLNQAIKTPSEDRDDVSSLYSRFLSVAPSNNFFSIRNYYNDFTTIDWTKAFISTNKFNYELEKSRWFLNGDERELAPTESRASLESTTSMPNIAALQPSVRIPFYVKAYFVLGKWALIVLISFVFSLMAYFIDKIEILLVGFKHGYCRSNWFASQVSCCVSNPPKSDPQVLFMNVFESGFVFKSSSLVDNPCPDWISWSQIFDGKKFSDILRYDYLIYVSLTILLAHCACLITLSTKITGVSSLPANAKNSAHSHSPRVMYTACGSGVPEVKTILSGFVIRRFLGTYALFAKSVTLILAIASGMSLGKEGPYVHLATAVGNIASRFFPFINTNDALKKQILCASASAGVALAFGSPLGGVLFILEEINHYLPSNQLFQIFFCAIVSTLFLKFLNPYGTGKTVLFELKYNSDWKAIELVFFIGIGIAGGVFGAAFVKFTTWWPKKFRQTTLIKNHPVFEVFCVALLTGLVTFWNPYTKQASSELVLDLATPCSFSDELDSSLCPTTHSQYTKEIGSLAVAFVVKVILTFITFGLKLPCGIYVPSMVAGALYGRIVGMIIQWFNFTYNVNDSSIHAAKIIKFICSTNKNECVDLGIYSMISAGAFMAGVTRMNITLVTILFELTSSYTYVLPISISIAVANWAGGLLEKSSLYESILESNGYPFMASESEAINPFVKAGDIINEIETFEEEPDSVNLGNLSVPEYLTSNNDTQNKLYIDISDSPYISSSILESKLFLLASKGLLDGCIPIIRNRACVGLITFSDLEFCLDKLKDFCSKHNISDDLYCKLQTAEKFSHGGQSTKMMRIHQHHNSHIISNILKSRQETDYFSYGSTSIFDSSENVALIETLGELTNLVKHVDCSPIFLNYDSELSLAHLIFDKIGNTVIVLLKDGTYYGVLHKKVLIDFCRQKH